MNTNKLINISEFLKGILIVFSYILLIAILSILFSFFKNLKLINFTIYFSCAILYSIIYLKDLINDFKDFKNNYKTIIKTTFKYWLIGFIIMIISSIIIAFLKIEINANQEANIELLNNMPLIEFICAVLFAPIIEELIFRRSFKNISSNKHIYAITSGLIFALLHVTSSLTDNTSLIMLIYLIPYGALGIAFGYAYRKTNNIYGTMIMHSFHNALSLLQIILIGCII